MSRTPEPPPEPPPEPLPEIGRCLEEMATALRQRLTGIQEEPLLVGIQRGGVWIAHRLHRLLALRDSPGELNIAFYRDDFSRIGVHPRVLPSRLPATVEGRHVILVDDVLYTGRTVRAALNEIFDFGRPDSVILTVLIDRGGRELPVQADVVGRNLSLQEGEQVRLRGPEPLRLERVRVS